MRKVLSIALFVLLLSVAGLTNAFAQPTGAINGLFSVREDLQVYFSQGNLQYQASTDTWRFAENQWDYVGTLNPAIGGIAGGTVPDSDNSNISPTYDGWIDLFGWGTSGYDLGAVCYQPWSISTEDNDYFVYGGMYNLYDQTGQADWGYNAINNGGNAENSGWRTLTREEWKYLFSTRNTTSGIRWAQGTVNGIGGIIILPDDWSASVYVLNNTNGGDYSSNIITAEDWTNVLEAHGAVFLPAAGVRHTSDGTGVSGTGEEGFYWSSSHTNSSWYAYCVGFESDGIFDLCDSNYNRHLGSSVRLVHSFVIKVTSNPEEGGTVSGIGAYTEGNTCTLTATANFGYIFANWTENGEEVSTEATYSFTVTCNRNLVANFLYAISVVVMPEDGGTVSGVGMDETDSLAINYDFNNGMQGWTTIDADGDSYDWYVGNGGFAISQSWSNNVVLYPDNYLISPPVILGGSIAFMARAGDNAYAAEHFGVAVSTTGTNASDFTMVQEWTMSAKAVGNWYEYTVDLSSFSGMGYVAIRHFNCSDMYALHVDDVVIETPSSFTSYIGGYEEGQTCTLTAVPNDGWTFINWMENGVEVSTETSYSFTVMKSATYVANFSLNTYHFITAGTWSTASNWQGGALPGIHDEVFIDAPCQLDMNATLGALTISDGQSLTLQSGKTLNIMNTLTNTANTGLIIEDGAQLIHASENVSATVKKTIVGHGITGKGNYYLISNPLTSIVNPELASIYHITRGNYDLYDWFASAPDSLEWRNYKTNDFMMSPDGYGYLYANQNGMEINFPGILRSSYYRFGKSVNYDSGDSEHPGWNLIGNPFVCEAYLVNANNELLPYYRMNAAGDGFEAVETGAIAPMEGVFYQASQNGTVYFTRTDFTSQKPYSISVSANPTGGGIVNGGGTYDQGQNCTLTATPNEGYTFTNWTENDDVVSTDAAYTFTVNTNRTLVANFTENYNYVDLGLPSGTLWATCNVGANNPEDYGDYFAWGETQPKDYYDWSTYQYCNGSYNTLTKYCNDSLFGYNSFTDDLTVLEPMDDAATTNWGSGWRMPTYNEWIELFQNTSYIWTTLNGVKGQLFTASNGNSLFLPATGYRYGNNNTSLDSWCYYWTSSLNADSYSEGPHGAWYYFFFMDEVYLDIYGLNGANRYCGMTVRPVRTEKEDPYLIIGATTNPAESGEVSGGGSYHAGTECTLTATANNGYAFTNWTENGEIVSVEATYSFVVTDNRTLVANFMSDGSANYGCVDLGLPSGLLWATCNVGAVNPEDYGDYFAWGEIQPKEEYSWSTYQYCNGSESTLTKYCNDPEYGYNGFTDDLTTLLPEDDAATANWGSGWRMPSELEWQELIDNTTSEWITQNGVEGYLLTASNGNSLFLPAAGCRYENNLNGAGQSDALFYWSGLLNIENPSRAWATDLWANFSGRRFIGYSVRPVRSIQNNAPTGAINGKFTINGWGDQVYFSQGNLQYQASTNTWKFADNQYDYVGNDNSNISSTYSGWIDLFGWGTSGYNHGAVCYQPWSTSTYSGNYYAYDDYQSNLYDGDGRADWGYNAISNGGSTTNQWRTLTIEEWHYLVFTRTTTSGLCYAKANVNNVNGIILLPDDWSSSTYILDNTNDRYASFSSNIISPTQWNTLESAGAVFLPAAGSRSGTSAGGTGSYGIYWLASAFSDFAHIYAFYDNEFFRSFLDRYNGFSVRLVTPIEN